MLTSHLQPSSKPQKPHPNRNFTQDAFTTSDPSTFLPESQEDSVSLKKLGKITGSYFKSISSTCYIPERNLFLALPSDSKTVYIYSTRNNFKLIARKNAEIELSSITYSKELDKILVAGCFIQIWNPKTFKLEAQSPKISQNNGQGYSLAYLPEPNVIVVKTTGEVHAYNRDLTLLSRFKLPSDGYRTSSTAEIFSVSKDLLLVVWRQRSLLLNLKKETVFEFDDLDFPWNSCVEVIQETPNKVFICLIEVTHYFGDDYQPPDCALVQLTIDPKTENRKISAVGKTEASFHRLVQLENSKFFLAERENPQDISEVYLLRIEKDQMEVIRVISGLTNLDGNFIMMKNESLMVHGDSSGLWLYKCKIRRNSKKSKSQERDRPEIKIEEKIDPLESYLPEKN